MTASLLKTRFVAEVSSNHHRDLERCLLFVDEAAACGCAAVKFQQFRIRELFAPEALRHAPQLLQREAWELPEEFNAELAGRAHERGIQFASTPFYLDAVEVLEPHVDFFKVASYQLLWHELLERVGRTEKPVVLATGMATLEEVRAAVTSLRAGGCHDLTLLHCVSAYPTLPEDANLAAIDSLREFTTRVGWSDHTVSPQVVERAVRHFASDMIEFHLDLDGEGEEFAGGHCWLPHQIREVIRGLGRYASVPVKHAFDGKGKKEPRECELEERAWRTDPADGLRPLLATRADLLAGAEVERKAA
jgi:sialic acid synthase SpsE